MIRSKELLDSFTDKNQVERLLTCIEISKTLVSTFDMETLLTAVLERINTLVPASNWSLLLIDPQAQELYFSVAVGLDLKKVGHIRLKVGEGIAGTVARTGKPIFIKNARRDKRFCSKIDELTGFETRSIICLPLIIRGVVIGVIEVINLDNENFFRKKYLPLLAILTDYVAIAVDNVRNFQKLQVESFIDDVTGYYNTRYLTWHLDKLVSQVLSDNSELSVVFLDIDDFKKVVDRYGHLQGSKVLKEIAQVIGSILSPRDSLIRYGGDEFIVLLPGQSKDRAYDFVCQLRETVNQSRFLLDEGLNLALTASYGIATLPYDATDKQTLLLLADRAMYSSKDRGKDTIMLGMPGVDPNKPE
ncbi:MAG: diguanylate cyclase [Desulfobacteraceae bacterium]